MMMMASQSVAMCTSARVAAKAGASSAKPAGRVAVRVTASVAGKGFVFDSKPRRGGLVVAHGKKEDAAKRALQGAFGGASYDPLTENDGPGGFGGGGRFGGFWKKLSGGGGGDGWLPAFKRLGPLGMFAVVFAIYWLFKPVTAVLVNLVFFVFKIPTGREPEYQAMMAAKAAAAKAAAPADADIIARYGADDDDDFEDDDEDDEDE